MKRRMSRILLSVGTVIVILSMLLSTVSLAAVPAAAGWAGNRLKEHRVWDPAPAVSDWVPGHPKGYNEGETASFYVKVDPDAAGEELMFDICLDYDDSGAHAFIGLEPWNTTYEVLLPNGVGTGGLTDTTSDPNVWAYNANIDSVTSLGEAGGRCPSNYLAWHVEFTIVNDADTFIVYGGHLAAPGEPLPFGGVVPDGMGAASCSGVFQARIASQGTGDKTVNFSPALITPQAGTIIVDKVTDPSGSSQSFEFDPSYGSNFFLTDAATPNDSGWLLPGAYSV
ncbi:MAG: hypothetical protein MUP04_04100, partial [Anaerolineae bacterium]|nr:hypothetical protein [Anaerolineae bacterium]